MGELHDDLDLLFSEDPRERFTAAGRLREDYRQEAGEALVRALCREKDDRIFWIFAVSVIPVWIPMLDTYIMELGEWPFDPKKTFRVIEGLKGKTLHSAEPLIESWTQSKSTWLRLAGLRYRLHRTEDTESQLRDLFALKLDAGRELFKATTRDEVFSTYNVISHILTLEQEMEKLAFGGSLGSAEGDKDNRD